MNIIVKFIIKNIKEKKLRTSLIIISVAAACALFFASNGIADSFKSTFTQIMKSSVGNADIEIFAGKKSPSQYFNMQKSEIFKDKTDYIIGETDGFGSYKLNNKKSINVMINGIDYDDLMTMNPVSLIQQQGLRPFTGNKIILSENIANQYHFEIGQRVKIKINDDYKEFSIVGIARQTSIFKNEKENIIAAVPRETVNAIYSQNGKVTTVYIKAKNADDKDQLIKNLSNSFRNYNVQKTIDDKEIDSDLSSIKTGFSMMLIVVLIMSVFLIYTAFKVIVMERLPIIGTFRSIGATKRKTNMAFFIESIIYGIIGGLIGDILGIGILYAAGMLANKSYQSITVALNFHPELLAETLAFGILVSLISSMVPIIRVNKFSIKDIILNNTESHKNKKAAKSIFGVVLLLSGIAMPLIRVKNISLMMMLDVISVIFIVASVIILISYIVNIFVKITGPLFSAAFGNEGILASKSLITNKSILNNMCLLCIGISALFMINSVSVSMSKEVAKAYNLFTSDICMYSNYNTQNLSNPEKDRQEQIKIKKTDGVADFAGIMEINNVDAESKNTKNKIMCIDSISSRKFPYYIDAKFVGDTKSIPVDFDNGRNIMIAKSLKTRFGIDEGDIIALDTVTGIKSYKVSAVFDTLMNDGDFAFIPERYMKNDFNENTYGMYFVKTNKDNEYVKDNLSSKFDEFTVRTMSEQEKRNEKSLSNMMTLLRMFPLISVLIGTFGVINNFIISFIERRHSFAIMTSVGMSRKQNKKLIFIEALSVGIIGGILGLAVGYFMSFIAAKILSAMEFPMPIHYDISLFVECFALAAGISIVSSVAAMSKSTKMNVIDALKYE